ncbi:MAG: hypothetical protein ACRDRH_22410, partial [Pseudonocardia sp.]
TAARTPIEIRSGNRSNAAFASRVTPATPTTIPHDDHLTKWHWVQGCCPTAEFAGDSVTLRDDFKGEVKLTWDEWSSFLAKAKAGELD